MFKRENSGSLNVFSSIVLPIKKLYQAIERKASEIKILSQSIRGLTESMNKKYKESKVYTTVEKKGAKADYTEIKSAEEVIEVKEFSGNFSEVGVDMGLTMNLGNYESARFGVSFRVPCEVGKEIEVYNDIKNKCEKKIQDEVQEMRRVGALSSTSKLGK